MFRLFKKISVFSLLPAGLALSLKAPTASAATIHHVTTGQSIQAAIDGATAGDIVEVEAGVFTEQINIDKALTLRGAQAGIDARTRNGSETILKIPTGSTYAIQVQTSDVAINGFTIDGQGSNDPTGIMTTVGVRQNLNVSYNIITNHRVGVSAYTGTNIQGLTVQYNLFEANNNTSNGSGASLYLNNSSGSDIVISDNRFRDTDDGQPGSSNAILISSANPGDINGVVISDNDSTRDGSFVYMFNIHNVQLLNNTAKELRGHGVLVSYGVKSLTVSGNTFSSSASGVRLAAAANLDDSGSIADIKITGNTISDMSLAAVSITDGVLNSPLSVTGNNLAGNQLGILNQSSLPVDANDNWWGCAGGPGADGCAGLSGIVLASSWYTSPDMNQTNLDELETEVPGVPNTGSIASTGSLMISWLIMAVVLMPLTLRHFNASR